MHTNDPQHPETVISLSCTVKKSLSIQPSFRVNLIGFEGEKLRAELTITSLEAQPFKITEITSTLEDKIKYKLSTIKEGAYRLEIKNRSTRTGTFDGHIALKTTSQVKPRIVIPVLGTLREEVHIIPKSLSFGTIDTTKEYFNSMVFKRSVFLRDTRGNGFTIKKIKTSSDWINAEMSTQESGKECTLIVTLNKDKLPRGKFEEQLFIRTSGKKKPLVVDIEGEVR